MSAVFNNFLFGFVSLKNGVITIGGIDIIINIGLFISHINKYGIINWFNNNKYNTISLILKNQNNYDSGGKLLFTIFGTLCFIRVMLALFLILDAIMNLGSFNIIFPWLFGQVVFTLYYPRWFINDIVKGNNTFKNLFYLFTCLSASIYCILIVYSYYIKNKNETENDN